MVSVTGLAVRLYPFLGFRRNWLVVLDVGWEFILKFTQSLIQHRRDAYCTSAGRTLAALGNR
jgi:hypothetical protein